MQYSCYYHPQGFMGVDIPQVVQLDHVSQQEWNGIFQDGRIFNIFIKKGKLQIDIENKNVYNFRIGTDNLPTSKLVDRLTGIFSF